MSVSGIDYNIDQSLTGNGLDTLNLNTLNVNTLNNISSQTLSYLDATSSIQNQFTDLTYSTDNNFNTLFNYMYAGGSGGYFCIYGEIADLFTTTNGGYFTFGGSLVSLSLDRLGIFTPDCTLVSVYVCTTRTSNTDAVISIKKIPTAYLGDVNSVVVTTLTIGIDLVANLTDLNIPFAAGDAMNVKVTSSSGSSVGNTRITLIFKTNGITGPAGANGITPNLSIGSVSNLAAGNIPSVSIDNTTITNPILNFGLVRGQDGTNGITPNFTIGQVNNLTSGNSPSVSISGTLTNPVLNFGLVQGQQGIQGIAGTDGTNGTNGINGTNGTSFTWRGTYNRYFTYYINDVVFDDATNSSYICVNQKDGTNQTFGSTFTLLAQQGGKGDRGSNGSNGSDGSDGKDGKDGSNGSNGSSPSITDIISALITGAVIAGILTDVEALHLDVAALTLALTATNARVTILENKTTYQTILGTSPNATTFTSDLNVIGAINAASSITTTTSVNAPSITATTSLTATNINYASDGILNIGRNGTLINNINIGGATDLVYINGVLFQPYTNYFQNNFINQFP